MQSIRCCWMLLLSGFPRCSTPCLLTSGQQLRGVVFWSFRQGRGLSVLWLSDRIVLGLYRFPCKYRRFRNSGSRNFSLWYWCIALWIFYPVRRSVCRTFPIRVFSRIFSEFVFCSPINCWSGCEVARCHMVWRYIRLPLLCSLLLFALEVFLRLTI